MRRGVERRAASVGQAGDEGEGAGRLCALVDCVIALEVAVLRSRRESSRHHSRRRTSTAVRRHTSAQNHLGTFEFDAVEAAASGEYLVSFVIVIEIHVALERSCWVQLKLIMTKYQVSTGTVALIRPPLRKMRKPKVIVMVSLVPRRSDILKSPVRVLARWTKNETVVGKRATVKVSVTGVFCLHHRLLPDTDGEDTSSKEPTVRGRESAAVSKLYVLFGAQRSTHRRCDWGGGEQRKQNKAHDGEE